MYLNAAVNAPLHQTFVYKIPPALEGQIVPGHLVRVPFRTSQAAALVVELTDHTDIKHVKSVDSLIDPTPVLTPDQIALARWMSEAYLAPIGLCLWLWIPSGLEGHRDTLLTLLDESAHPADAWQADIVDVLRRRGPLRLTQIKQSVGSKGTDKAVAALVKAGVIEQRSMLAPPRVRPQTIQTASLAIAPQDIPRALRLLGRKSRRADLLQSLADLTREADSVPVKALLESAGSTRATLRRLADEGLIALEDDAVRLNIPRDTVDETLLGLRKGERELHILRVLSRESEPLDVSWIYAQTGAKLDDLKRLADRELISFDDKPTWRDSLAERDFVPATPPQLTPEQQGVWDVVRSVIDARQHMAYLLHGVTGSGKTEIYLRAIEAVLAQGRQAIFLVPEIALTAQTVRRVAARFRGKVAIIHHKLSDGERYDAWRRAREGLARVIVGPRSALYAPLPDCGLIVIDEEHDTSYKNFSTPTYDTRAVAEQMMIQRGGVLILGSATPDVSTFYRAQHNEIGYLHLPNRIMGHRVRIEEQSEREGLTPKYHVLAADALTIDLPPVHVVDMRAELKRGNTSMFSQALQTALTRTLEQREQAILFLNRRGASTYVFCRDCGEIARCSRCDTPLTHHAYDTRLRCHHCGHEEPTPQVCAVCGSKRVRFFGAGTQQVEQAVRESFPQARVVRWDADTASNPEIHDTILMRFLNREADVMVGTQMVAKGLDLPRVTLVGVVSADTALGLPDFRAGERAFQILTQVAGRAGRGILGGQVILQTYHPDHYAIRAAAAHDYAAFYQRELTYRRELGYPPFRRLAKLLFQDKADAQARTSAEHAEKLLRQKIGALKLTATELIGPAPCFFHRVNDQYRWQILIRSPDPLALLRHVDAATSWHVEIDPVDVL